MVYLVRDEWNFQSQGRGLFLHFSIILLLFLLSSFRYTGIAAVEHMRWVTIRC